MDLVTVPTDGAPKSVEHLALLLENDLKVKVAGRSRLSPIQVHRLRATLFGCMPYTIQE